LYIGYTYRLRVDTHSILYSCSNDTYYDNYHIKKIQVIHTHPMRIQSYTPTHIALTLSHWSCLQRNHSFLRLATENTTSPLYAHLQVMFLHAVSFHTRPSVASVSRYHITSLYRRKIAYIGSGVCTNCDSHLQLYHRSNVVRSDMI
jgi:hypothetical protein